MGYRVTRRGVAGCMGAALLAAGLAAAPAPASAPAAAPKPPPIPGKTPPGKSIPIPPPIKMGPRR